MPPTNRRPRAIDTSMHFCPQINCDYRGWLGRGNLRANGHPSGGPWRQFQCTACTGYFLETHGTLLGVGVATERKPGMFPSRLYKQGVVELFCLNVAATSRQTRPWRLSVSYDQRHLIGSRFSRTIGAIRNEKSISIIGFEKGKLLHLRCACHGRCLAHNRSISRNGHPETSLRVSRTSSRPTSKSNFPVFRSAATQTPYPPDHHRYATMRAITQDAPV
jgi:hypothetical protein